jgi:hypothetical protein
VRTGARKQAENRRKTGRKQARNRRLYLFLVSRKSDNVLKTKDHGLRIVLIIPCISKSGIGGRGKISSVSK